MAVGGALICFSFWVRCVISKRFDETRNWLRCDEFDAPNWATDEKEKKKQLGESSSALDGLPRYFFLYLKKDCLEVGGAN